MATESQDSRKRPLDGDAECGMIKRSNQGFVSDGNVQIKVLVPSVAAGAIIGKGGETITLIQKDTGASIKMSKANDYYPGTTERVCLISGSIESVKNVVAFMMEKIREKPDPNPKPVDGELKVNLERHKQVKLLVPNSTAGMIIGKGGNFIKQVKEESGAYVQISQKSKDVSLPERCVTIAGKGDPEQNNLAVEMIIEKVKEDPQSASCPNISYQDYHGPVASTNPTGSPYASNQGTGQQQQVPSLLAPTRMPVPNNSLFSNNLANNMNNLNLNSSGGSNVANMPPPQAPPAPLPPPQTAQQAPQQGPAMPGPGAGISTPALENLKATLRGSGYSEHATEEITAAMFTLAGYGFLGMGMGLGGPSTGLNLGGGTGLGGLNMGGVGNTAGTLSLASLANILAGGSAASTPQPPPLLGSGGAPGSNDGGGSVFGPVGSGSSVIGAGGDADQNSSSLFSNNPGGNYPPTGNSMFSDNGFGSNGFNGPNQNSFGLGTDMGSNNINMNSGDENGGISKKEIEVGEHIVGAILGPGGRGIVELQQYSGANIQISKKGVYAPGTRNRIVSITGNPHSITRAQTLISQRITQEEAKRARQGQNVPPNMAN